MKMIILIAIPIAICIFAIGYAIYDCYSWQIKDEFFYRTLKESEEIRRKMKGF